MTTPLPTAAVRALLLADPDVTAACGGRISTRLPADMTQPCYRVRGAGGIALDDRGWTLSPLLHIESWCAPGAEDPETVTWRMAMLANRVIGRSRCNTYTDSDGSVTYSIRVLDVTPPEPDVSRGSDTPLYWAVVRVELRLQTA